MLNVIYFAKLLSLVFTSAVFIYEILLQFTICTCPGLLCFSSELGLEKVYDWMV